MLLPLVIKLAGATLGAFLADKAVQKVIVKKVLQEPDQAGKPVTLEDTNAQNMPEGGADDDSEITRKAGSNRGNKRSDSGVSDKPDDGEIDNAE